MKILLFIALSALSTDCNQGLSNTPSQANGNVQASQRAASNDKANGQAILMKEQGISFTLPVGWRKDDDRTDTEAGEYA